jgi:hypothetical protein
MQPNGVITELNEPRTRQFTAFMTASEATFFEAAFVNITLLMVPRSGALFAFTIAAMAVSVNAVVDARPAI